VETACRTLVVEDDPLSAKTLTRLLRHLGHTVECATTVTDALRKLDEFRPDFSS
jgi:CheY-like chemotaxis protein